MVCVVGLFCFLVCGFCVWSFAVGVFGVAVSFVFAFPFRWRVCGVGFVLAVKRDVTLAGTVQGRHAWILTTV